MESNDRDIFFCDCIGNIKVTHQQSAFYQTYSVNGQVILASKLTSYMDLKCLVTSEILEVLSNNQYLKGQDILHHNLFCPHFAGK